MVGRNTMNLRILATLLCVVPGLGFAAERTSEARLGVNRVAQAGKRMPTMSVSSSVNKVVSAPSANSAVTQKPSGGNSDNSGNLRFSLVSGISLRKKHIPLIIRMILKLRAILQRLTKKIFQNLIFV